MHEALKQIRFEGDELVVVSKLKAEGLLDDTTLDALLIKLKEVVYHPDLNSYFKKGLKVITERPVLKKDEKIRIPDRVVLQNGAAIIIDYKTGSEKTSHKRQIIQYAELLQKMGYEITKKLLVYIEEERVVSV